MSKLIDFKKELFIKGFDAAIIYDELNIHYISGFAFSDGLLLITKNDSYLLTDFRYYELALNCADKEFQVVTPDNHLKFVIEMIKKHGCGNIAIECDHISYNTFKRYEAALSDAKLCDLGNTVEVMRQIKTDHEISLIDQAQKITDKAFSELLKNITPDMTEIEVTAELEYSMKKNGADGLAFDTIAVSGDASAIPHGKPRNIKLKPGFLTMDFGAKYKGYCSDMTRTIVIGKADDDMKRLYNTVLMAQKSALDYLCEGADGGEADKIARDIIDAKYKGAFGHSLGHSVGLYIHEAPGLSKRYLGQKLLRNQILTVEPGIYLFGKYGCRIEDMVCIKENGVLNFTHSTKELIEIY